MTIAHGAISFSGSLAGTTGVETDDWATGRARQVLDGVELARGCAGHGDAGGLGGVLVGWDADAAGVPHRNRGGGRPVSGLKAYRRDALAGPREGRDDR